MPGIFGFVLPRPKNDAKKRAQQLSQDLCLFDWQKSTTIEAVEGQVYLGAAWNELAPAARGASQFSAPDVSCVLDGYLVRTRKDCGAPEALASCRYAEAAVLAYKRFGDDFIANLEGPFSLVLYDHHNGRLIGATERHGLSPLYRYDGPEGTVFCSILGPMARSGLFPSSIDPASAATHLGHHHLFYRQSLLAGVELQDPATIAEAKASESGSKVRKYWHYGQSIPRDNTAYTQRIDELCDTFVDATDRILKLPGRLFTSLSGGLDSRLMTGLALRQGASLEAWTFGGPGALDMEIASRICSNNNIPHHTFSGDSDDILKNIHAYATILNGSGPLQNAYGLTRCHALRNKTDRILNGYRGGVVLGNAIVDLGIRARLRWLRGRFGFGPKCISPNLEDARSGDDMSLFYHAISHQAAPRIADWTVVPEPSLAGMFSDALANPLANTPTDFKIEQWTEEFGGGRHLTLVSIFADRHFYADSSIFYDYDVRDRCFAISPSNRRGNKAYVDVLTRLMPDLAREIYANSGVPANYHGRRLLVAKGMHRLANRNRPGSTGLNNTPWLLVPDIRDFCGDMINSASFQSRPWWNGPIIAQDFDGCLKGTNGLLAEFWDAITLEIFARQWIDTIEKEL